MIKPCTGFVEELPEKPRIDRLRFQNRQGDFLNIAIHDIAGQQFAKDSARADSPSVETRNHDHAVVQDMKPGGWLLFMAKVPCQPYSSGTSPTCGKVFLMVRFTQASCRP